MNQTQISVNHRQIGYRIKEVREQNHISQAQLAEMTDLSISYISHIENAKRKASLESIIRIVNALGITVDELLAGVQMNNPAAYQTDIDMLMEDCSENEKRFIYELIKATGAYPYVQCFILHVLPPPLLLSVPRKGNVRQTQS